METLRTCVNCQLWTDKKSSWSNRWHWCSEVDLYTPADQECVCGKMRILYEDLEEELDEGSDLYYEDDESLEVGFDPYLGCYSDDC